jgi:hypothetical protein
VYIPPPHATKGFIILTDNGPFASYKCIGIDELVTLPDKEQYEFILAYSKDYLASEATRQLAGQGLKYSVLKQFSPVTRYFLTDKNAFETLENEKNNNVLSHFCPPDFENIFQALAATKDLAGDYIEIGVFQGASARAALNYMKRSSIQRKTYFLDTYEGFTYDAAKKSEDVIWAGSHTETSVQSVKEYLSGYSNVNVIKSNIITDALPEEVQKIAVANIDVDMYEAVKAALYKVHKLVVRSGIIILEDYGHTPGLVGAQKAAHEFLEECGRREYTPLYMASGQLFLIKK